MLLRFEVSNHRSIMEPVEFSMIAVDTDRPPVRTFDLLNEGVLTVAGVYGPNASGKSNVLNSLVWLSMAAAMSLRTWESSIPREPFRFGQGPETPSTFELDMMVDGVRYSYRLDVSDSEVLFEGLYSYPERRRRSLFEREGMELSFRRGLKNLSGTRDLLTRTTLALSAAMRFDDDEIGRFGRKLANIGVLGRMRPARTFLETLHLRRPGTEQIFFNEIDPDQSVPIDVPDVGRSSEWRSALALLRFADMGIDDIEVVVEPMSSGGRRPNLRLVHRVADQQLPFDMTEESAGTQTWFDLIGPTLRALQAGQTLLFDQIDASLHPRLSARLLELFADPETNPHGAQLIFTTHDTSLLNHLNRDEVWLTEKAATGATTLTALAEYGGDKVRRSLNLEKAYLQGRFGAVPELDQFLLRQALGLTTGET